MRALWRDLQYLTDTYRGERPLADFLKAHFKQNHRLGSRDRKLLTEAAFSWYRAAQGFPKHLDFPDKMKSCIRLCGTEKRLSALLGAEEFYPEKPLSEKHQMAQGQGFDLQKLLPEDVGFSVGMERKDWLLSTLQQPRLFVRLRPHANRKDLLAVLQNAAISFEETDEQTLALPANTPLHTLWPEAGYTVQDWGSQQVCGYLSPQKGESWWDTCAGGGGKSLFLKDAIPDLRLLASDIRPQALRALESRFKAQGAQLPQTRVADASDAQALASQMGAGRFDAIVCDVPCSGSGTWARTPEMRHFFRKENLPELSALQTRIATNSLRYLKPKGRLVYMTCSVFAAENEAVVEKILSANPTLQVIETALANGIPQQADSLFVTVLQLPE